jgi:PAS domain S-box-containing protein
VVSAPGSTTDTNEPALAPLFALKVLDSLPDLVCYVEPDLRYRFVNNAYQAWFGLERSEVMGRHVSEFLGEESYRKVKPHLDRALSGEPATYTVLQPYKHGQPRRVEARLIPDLADDGEVRGFFAVVRDVSHRELIYQQILSVLDGMDASFLALDQDGRINFMNAAAERFLTASDFNRDLDRETVFGRRPWEVNPETRDGLMHQAFDRVRASGKAEAFEFRPPLRPERILDMRVFPTPSGAVGFSGIDITERRRAEDELRRKEERLRLALDAAHMMAFDHNARTGETHFSDNVQAVLGERPAAGYASRFHPQDRDRLMAAQDRVLETGTPSDLTIRFQSSAEGEWQWMNLQATRALDAEGRPVRLIGVMRDVTRAHMADELLRSANIDLRARVENEAAERLKAVLDRERFWTLSRDLYAVVTLDTSGGRLRRINAAAWKAALGYDSEQLLGEPLRKFIHPDDLAPTLAEVAKLFQDVPMVEFEYRVRHAEGGWRWMSWKVISDGEFSYAAGRDVTDDKAREEQERRTQKLEALGQLTGGVAHDFNNILTVIMGALDLVEKRPDDAARRKTLISSALVAAKKGEMLNKQLLGFARRQAAHREFVIPVASLEEMAPLIHGALGDSIPLEIVADGETRGVMTDPAQFEVAVLNLVVNARDAMPDGGALRISVRAARTEETRRLSLPDGDYLAVDVKDTGTGMSSDVLAHVFEPFFTTKEIGKGSGLGLAQVYGFARQCGGTADIQTAQGMGTTVSLYLPASQPPPAIAAPEPAPIAGAVSPKRILLVEDDVLVGAVTESMLLDMGHEVTRAEEAAGAREALEHAEFDLLLTDVRMPGGTNGVQLAREATRSRPDLKVLLCSGWTDDQLDKEGLGGAWPLLAKPYDEVELERALREVLASG